MKTLLCKIFGHRWVFKWHRHNCYFAARCSRCGITPDKAQKRNINIQYK